MAVTQIHPIEVTLYKALDYIMNPEKTDEKILVTGQNCTPEFADIEFNLTKKEAGKEDGILAYHMIQSFAPNETFPEEAHEIGIKLAEKITDGKFQTVISTHIDRGHIHNHVIFNSVSDNAPHKKFDLAWSTYKVAEESDKLCNEYGLSVIIEKSGEKGKSYKEYYEDKKGNSWKSKLRETIDECVIKSQTYEEFIALMEARGYEYKRGKLPKFKAPDQKNFTKLRMLGAYYSEEKIRERIGAKIKTVGGNVTNNLAENSAKTPRGIKLVIDIENNVKMKQSAGLAQWAAVQNIKMITKTVNYITENKLNDYEVLAAKHADIKNRQTFSLSKIKETEAKIATLKKQIEVIDNYRKCKPVVEKLDKIVFKDKYRSEHQMEFILYEAALQNLKIYFPDGGTLPKISDLRTELNALYTEKNNLYGDYRNAQTDFKEIDAVKKNVDTILEKVPDKDEKNRNKNKDISD